MRLGLEEDHQPPDQEEADANEERLATLRLSPKDKVVGRPLAALQLEATGVTVLAVRRHGIRASDPTPETRLEASDTLVMRGTPEALAAAEIRLGRG